MIFYKILFITFIIIISQSFVYPLKRLSDEEATAKIDLYVDGLLKCKNFTGATLAVVRNGSILFTKGYGFANIRKNEKVTPDTKFAIASITKSFTAQLILNILHNKQ